MINGVNFFGPYHASDSIGRVAGLNISCLEASGMLHDVYAVSRPSPREKIDYGTIDENLIKSLKYNINIFHFNARRVPLYFSRLRENSLKDFYNIGFWVHEMPTIPSQWARQLEFFDEIWTPSSLCQSAVALSANIPVLKIPYPVEASPLSARMQDIAAGKKFEQFNFLTMFDVHSDAERKNPLLVVRAFIEAHAENPSVRLTMKTRNLSHDDTLQTLLMQISEKHKNITVIDGYLESHEICRLYDDADAYVSLHRAEGFGLTISDAMSRGIPVITTGYSGNMDFCNTDVRLVTYALRQVGHDRPRYRREDVWAEPDLDDAVDAFTELVTDHKVWVKRAMRARKRIQREFSVEKVGTLMRARLDLIAQHFTFPDDMSDRTIDHEVGISSTYGF